MGHPLEALAWLANLKAERAGKLPSSAVTGDGVDALLAAIEKALARDDEKLVISIAPAQARALAWLHENGDIIDTQIDAETGDSTVEVRLPPVQAGRFRAQFPEVAVPQGIAEPPAEDDY